MLQVVVFNFTFDTIFSSIGFPIRPVLAKAPGLDGRAVQGARLKFESLRRRGFESHSKQDKFWLFRDAVFFINFFTPRRATVLRMPERGALV